MAEYTLLTVEKGGLEHRDQITADGDEEAVALAVRATGEAIRDLEMSCHISLKWEMQVRDAAGLPICHLAFSIER